MKHYIGSEFETPGPGTVHVDPEDGPAYELETGYDDPDLPSHSKDGFQCGYGGSGPSQLAAALVADLYDKDVGSNPEIYHHVKFGLVADLPNGRWEIGEDRIRPLVEEKLENEEITN